MDLVRLLLREDNSFLIYEWSVDHLRIKKQTISKIISDSYMPRTHQL